MVRWLNHALFLPKQKEGANAALLIFNGKTFIIVSEFYIYREYLSTDNLVTIERSLSQSILTRLWRAPCE